MKNKEDKGTRRKGTRGAEPLVRNEGKMNDDTENNRFSHRRVPWEQVLVSKSERRRERMKCFISFH
jgi:hypothetical protein